MTRNKKLLVEIHAALWNRRFHPKGEDLKGEVNKETALEVRKEADKLVLLFYERGLSPIDQNIEYFVKNCI